MVNGLVPAVTRAFWGLYNFQKRCRYALVFPWAVTKAVKSGVSLMLVDSLSLMFGKNCFVVEPFGVQSHCLCICCIPCREVGRSTDIPARDTTYTHTHDMLLRSLVWNILSVSKMNGATIKNDKR